MEIECWYELLLKECSWETDEGLYMRHQLNVLCDLSYKDRSISRVCGNWEVAFRADWLQILKQVPGKCLEASIFAIISLTHSGFLIQDITTRIRVTPTL